MNNIDFIKKCCEFADGFTYGFNEYTEKAYVKYFQHRSSEKKSINQWAVYPLLLQRAIEGINNDIENSLYAIFLNAAFVNVILKGKTVKTYPIYIHQDEHNPDQAKTKALEYVFERIY